MTNEQLEFIQLSKQVETLKKSLSEANGKMEQLLLQIGSGAHFQDPEDKTVFEIVIPNGTFVSFKKIDYNRTKREGEAKGSLAVTRAKELGYSL